MSKVYCSLEPDPPSHPKREPDPEGLVDNERRKGTFAFRTFARALRALHRSRLRPRPAVVFVLRCTLPNDNPILSLTPELAVCSYIHSLLLIPATKANGSTHPVLASTAQATTFAATAGCPAYTLDRLYNQHAACHAENAHYENAHYAIRGSLARPLRLTPRIEGP